MLNKILLAFSELHSMRGILTQSVVPHENLQTRRSKFAKEIEFKGDDIESNGKNPKCLCLSSNSGLTTLFPFSHCFSLLIPNMLHFSC